MSSSPEPSPQVHVDESTSVDRPYKLLMTVPDLRRERPAAPLGNLRVNWRRRGGASAGMSLEQVRGWLMATPLRALAATLLGLLAVSWAAIQLGSSSESPPAEAPGVSLPAQGQATNETRQNGGGNVVSAGYETASNTQVVLPEVAAPSLFSLRPGRLAGAIETLEEEGAR